MLYILVSASWSLYWGSLPEEIFFCDLPPEESKLKFLFEEVDPSNGLFTVYPELAGVRWSGGICYLVLLMDSMGFGLWTW